MVYRIYVEKKKELANEAKSLLNDVRGFLGIEGVEDIRVINRYDVENIDKELFDACVSTVFSEPQVDLAYEKPDFSGSAPFAVEFLPGQFDQRADSAAQCIQIISQGERPTVRTAKVYLVYGDISDADIEKIKKYVINPVEACEATLDEYQTLSIEADIPDSVETLSGFIGLDDEGLSDFISSYGLAMDLDDIRFCRNYFISEERDPTITEIRMIDTYWSDHCRHTTFLTNIDSVSFEDRLIEETWQKYLDARDELGRTKPKTLMDIATIAVKSLKKQGKLDLLDESEEINACTVKMNIEVDGKEEPWLLLFKNETHNHPTEIEPFGGAATCIGGAIRDPLSGRSYVYGAMRVTGAADPLRSLDETIEGKLPQRKLVTTAAAGYSSYGNQIGLATGQVDELYHDGYAAKRMEIGAVIAATPAENVRRERPEAGDVVILLGGRTGRDGIGGATGSSKSHNIKSVETCGAEVQKGNAPEERKLQRLFRSKEACRMIKRCNDFGAGGVSVAIGELADGLKIDLNRVKKKYEGLDGTELAISESQERMAVVVDPKDAERFLELAESENLEATVVAEVRDEKRLVMTWNGRTIVDVSREFLNSNGATKHIDIEAAKAESFERDCSGAFGEKYRKLMGDLNVCSKRGLSERFDSTIGAGTVMMPFGGKYQLTPNQAMVQKISTEKKHTDAVSYMAWGLNPFISEKSPFHGAYLAVVESVSKTIAAGSDFNEVYLTFQEYFERPDRDGKRWGKPLSALLGAYKAQMDLGIGAIGGKDSMSGSFEKLDVPPTLVSFAVSHGDISEVVTPEFKAAGHKVYLLRPEYDENDLPEPESLKALFDRVTELQRNGKVFACCTPTYGGIAEAVAKMAFGNGIGFEYDGSLTNDIIFGYNYGAFIIEADCDISGALLLGITSSKMEISFGSEKLSLSELLDIYESKLETVFACNIEQGSDEIPNIEYRAKTVSSPIIKAAKPKVLIPVFPGTNCEYDSAKAIERAGGEAEIIVIKNLTSALITESTEYFANKLRSAQIVFIPGGFSGGDEPDGSGKFITAFFRNARIKSELERMLDERDGLMCGICNGFQALVKLGLVPFGKIVDIDESMPTLTFNTIGRHQSRIVSTRIASNKSPWLSGCEVGEVYNVPISHGEGRFLATDEVVRKLIENGQVATQYCDIDGKATNDIHFNPNGSVFAIEGITSPDGRIFGKMGHSERWDDGLYKNVPGNYDIGMFKNAVKYFE